MWTALTRGLDQRRLVSSVMRVCHICEERSCDRCGSSACLSKASDREVWELMDESSYHSAAGSHDNRCWRARTGDHSHTGALSWTAHHSGPDRMELRLTESHHSVTWFQGKLSTVHLYYLINKKTNRRICQF